MLADVVPGLNVEVVSPTNLLLSGNGTLGAAGRKGEIFRLRQFGGPEALANMGYTVRLRGAENATLDVFSVAVDLQGRVLLSVSTPAVEGINVVVAEVGHVLGEADRAQKVSADPLVLRRAAPVHAQLVARLHA